MKDSMGETIMNLPQSSKIQTYHRRNASFIFNSLLAGVVIYFT